MKLWPVEHMLNTFSTYLSSKLDSPSPMFWLEENLILMTNMLKKCSTCVQLVRVSSFRNDLLQNLYFRTILEKKNLNLEFDLNYSFIYFRTVVLHNNQVLFSMRPCTKIGFRGWHWQAISQSITTRRRPILQWNQSQLWSLKFRAQKNSLQIRN